MFKTLRSKVALATTGLVAAGASQAADYTALQTAVTTAISDAETLGLALMALSIVASLGISLGKKFIFKGAS